MSETLGEQEASEKRDRSPPEPSWLLPAKIASVVMGLMIIVGVIVLVVTVYKRMAGEDILPSKQSSQPVSATSIDLGEVELALPPRARVVDMALDGNRLVLHLQLASRDRALMIVDLRSGKSEGLIRLVPGELPK